MNRPRALLLALAMIAAGPAWSQDAQTQNADTLAKAREAAAPVTEAIAQALAAEAALPAPVSTREALERMGRLDQVGRAHIHEIRFATLSPQVASEVLRQIRLAMDPVDHANMAKLAGMIPADGWFTKTDYGETASDAAFHIVQHAADLPTRKALLPRLKPLAERGEINGVDYAALYDRTALWDGRKQRYGTQFSCVDRKIRPDPLEDPEQVEALRAGLRLPQTYADYVKAHAGQACG